MSFKTDVHSNQYPPTCPKMELRTPLSLSASLGIITEEVGHIFCARDYALGLNGKNCVFYVPNLASLVPKLIWPGTEGKLKLPMRSEATVGEFER